MDNKSKMRLLELELNVLKMEESLEIQKQQYAHYKENAEKRIKQYEEEITLIESQIKKQKEEFSSLSK